MAKAEFYQIQTVGRTLVRQKYLTPEPRAEARPTKKKDKQRPVGAQFNPRMARLHSRSEDRSYKIQIHQAVGRTLVRQKYLTPEPRAEARPTKKKDKQRPVGAQFNPRMAT